MIDKAKKTVGDFKGFYLFSYHFAQPEVIFLTLKAFFDGVMPTIQALLLAQFINEVLVCAGQAKALAG